jgi:CDP-4-dehydro-6-deoxyglucose reductase/ferredoxin-NAD(P)+ reductase (naphthalene dioxygenase ferredoxin-specific)
MTRWKIRIQQWPNEIVHKGGSILDSALDAGVPFPHGCRSGDCGQCKCHLSEGLVSQQACSPEALSRSEREAGYILACRSRPKSDVAIRWLADSASNQIRPVRIKTKVSSLNRLSRDVIEVKLTSSSQRLQFLPGQFARLTFKRLPPRSYSMAGLPDDDEISFHIRILPAGKVSSYLANACRIGDPVTVEAPLGTASWSGADDRPLVLAAGGTGFAPISSILRAALRDGQRRIHLYHGVRRLDDAYSRDYVQRLSAGSDLRYSIVCVEGDGGTDHRRGHLHEAIAEDFADFSGHRLFMAGPPPMTQALQSLVSERGARSDDVFVDSFTPAARTITLWQKLLGL